MLAMLSIVLLLPILFAIRSSALPKRTDSGASRKLFLFESGPQGTVPVNPGGVKPSGPASANQSPKPETPQSPSVGSAGSPGEVRAAMEAGFEEHFYLQAAKFTVHVSVEQVTPLILIVKCPKSPLEMKQLVSYRYGALAASAPAEYGPFTVEAKAFVESREFIRLLQEKPGTESAEKRLKKELDHALKKLAGLVCPIAAVRPEAVTEAFPAYSTDGVYRCSPTESSGPHTVAVSEAKRGLYPFWTGKPAAVSFSEPYSDYMPTYFNSISLYEKPWWSKGGYADANFISKSNDYDKKSDSDKSTLKRFSNSEIGALNGYGLGPSTEFKKSGFFELLSDGNKFPLNPCGRTGVIGRGTLGQWGPQFAADPIITKTVDIDGKPSVLVLMITRKEVNELKQPYLAIPGGILDRVQKTGIPSAESAAEAGKRELYEETGIDIDVFTEPPPPTLYKGYSDDLRNTDNAWMETTVIWRHIAAGEFTNLSDKLNEICSNKKVVREVAKCLRDRLNLAKFFVKVYKTLDDKSSVSGVHCFTDGLPSKSTKDVKSKEGHESAKSPKEAYITKLYHAVFGDDESKSCTAAGEVLGFSADSLKNRKTLSDLDAIKGMLKVQSNADITKFKDTLVYYSEEHDLITHDAGEGISARRWIKLDDLIKNPDRLWASHALFIQELKKLINSTKYRPTVFPDN